MISKFTLTVAVHIADIAIAMNLSQIVTNTAMNILHQLLQKSNTTTSCSSRSISEKFQKLPPFTLAQLTLFIASKYEDCPQYLSTIVATSRRILKLPSDTSSSSSGTSASSGGTSSSAAAPTNSSSSANGCSPRTLEQLQVLEAQVYRAIGFPRLAKVQPHVLIVQTFRNYQQLRHPQPHPHLALSPAANHEDKRRRFTDVAYFMCTAATLFSTLPLEFSAGELAVACFCVAANRLYQIGMDDVFPPSQNNAHTTQQSSQQSQSNAAAQVVSSSSDDATANRNVNASVNGTAAAAANTNIAQSAQQPHGVIWWHQLVEETTSSGVADGDSAGKESARKKSMTRINDCISQINQLFDSLSVELRDKVVQFLVRYQTTHHRQQQQHQQQQQLLQYQMQQQQKSIAYSSSSGQLAASNQNANQIMMQQQQQQQHHHPQQQQQPFRSMKRSHTASSLTSSTAGAAAGGGAAVNANGEQTGTAAPPANHPGVTANHSSASNQSRLNTHTHQQFSNSSKDVLFKNF